MNPNRTGMLTKINDHFFPEKENINQSFIYLRDEITLESCGEVIETILAINQPQFEEDDEGFMVEQEMPDVINLLITSHGGDMAGAFSLINVMKGSRIPIRTIVLGEACSAGLCISMAGHQRVITPYASLMSHCFSTTVDGQFHEIKNAMEEMNRYNEKMIQFYVDCTQLDPKFIKKNLLNHKDVYITAQKAIEYNMADLVCDLA